MRQRKTRDVFVVQTHTSCGWEDVSEEETRAEGRAQLKCYRENQPQYPHRLIRRREPIGATA